MNWYASKQSWTVMSIVLCFMIVISGCASGAKSTSGSTSEPASGAAATPAGTAAAADKAADAPYKVTHAMGETTIKGTPKRVVVLTNEGMEAVISLGIKPVGIVKAWGMDPIYQHLMKEFEGIPILGDENQPNLEQIAALKPDLILGNKFRQEKVYPQLSAIAPTVFSERIHGDWQINYKIYAEALNKKAEGEKKFAEFDARVQDLKQKLGDKINTKVSLVRFNPGGVVRIYYNDTFAGTLLKKVGLQRPEVQNKDKFSDDVGKERIPDMDGDVLFYFTYDNEKGEAAKSEQEWQNDPLWKNLNVVKNNNVHKVYDGIWNSSGGIISANLVLDDLAKYVAKK